MKVVLGIEVAFASDVDKNVTCNYSGYGERHC